VAIGPALAALVEAEPPAHGGGRGLRGGGARPRRDQRRGAAVARDLELRLLGGDLAPGARAEGPAEGALRRRDPSQLGVDDPDPAPREHLALDEPVAEALLVGVAFLVAVEEPRDGGVAPVDDLHAAARLDVTPRADEHVAPLAALLEAQVAEVGRLAI